ncbi:MAG: cysteine--tRNA ligase [Clostridiales bacterium]|nr:cysteine--tRNA ligase [Clostridiales bacterium]
MRIYNSMTRKKEEFQPVHEGEVKIYACGPTVYNFIHIGNARPLIVFDTLRRYFEYRGNKVTFVQNFTDIDDKMIRAANEQGITVKELGEHFIAEYFKDAQALNVRPATVHPQATEPIDASIHLISELIEKGHAYLAENGDVYYDVKSFEGYGKLSGQDLEDREAGARIEINDVKRDPMDFALWKAQKPGEPAWESPFGMGRPGWHIECSAMSQKILGDTLDIHGGGQDLKFPHHENEIAQSEGATGKPFANYWMHNGYINIDNKKMSKSLGNFRTVREITEQYAPIAVRLFMLSAQYRNPLNFSAELLEQAESGLKRIYNCVENLNYLISSQKKGKEQVAELDEFRQRFIAVMDDDLNTADAVSVIFELVREINTLTSENEDAALAEQCLGILRELLDVLGLWKEEDEIPEEILALAEQRAEARAQKNWALADEIRDTLKQKGYEIKDGADGMKINKI